MEAAAHHPKTDIFAVGDDANLPLLKLLARNGGVTGACAFDGADRSTSSTRFCRRLCAALWAIWI
jgi:hypothetical protein